MGIFVTWPSWTRKLQMLWISVFIVWCVCLCYFKHLPSGIDLYHLNSVSVPDDDICTCVVDNPRVAMSAAISIKHLYSCWKLDLTDVANLEIDVDIRPHCYIVTSLQYHRRDKHQSLSRCISICQDELLPCVTEKAYPYVLAALLFKAA